MTCLGQMVLYSLCGTPIYGGSDAAGQLNDVLVTTAGSFTTCLVPTVVYSFHRLWRYGGVVAAGYFNDMQDEIKFMVITNRSLVFAALRSLVVL